MKNLEETYYDMRDENTSAAKLQESFSEAGQRRESLYWQMEELRKGYGRKLRTLLQKRAARIVRKNSTAWHVDVDVKPMHNHTTLPLIVIRWADRGTELRMTAIPPVPCMVEQAVVKASQLHRREADDALAGAISDSLEAAKADDRRAAK